MKIIVKHDDGRNPLELEIDEQEFALMIETDYSQRLETSKEEDKLSITRRTPQELIDEQNRESYNSWHKQHRHTVSNITKKDNEEINLYDYHASKVETPSQYVEKSAMFERLEEILTPEYYDILINVVGYDVDLSDYAKENGISYECAKKRLQRAKKIAKEKY